MGHVVHGRIQDAERLHGARAAAVTLDGWASNMKRLATKRHCTPGERLSLSTCPSFARRPVEGSWPGALSRLPAHTSE